MDGLTAVPDGGADILDSRGTVIVRPRLFERLREVPAGGVVLICATAGSGKTQLLRSWIETEGLAERAAWVGVERSEPDTQRFWLGVVDVLADLPCTAGAVERVAPAPDLRDETVVRRLLADLESLDEPVICVIDDLHELAPEALAGLALFIERMPSSVRLVLSTREEPPLDLHRVRVAGRLTEIRTDDLDFSLTETSELVAAEQIELSDEALELLHDRTEGWAAGLRLAAISMAAHPDPGRFVSEFSGSERTVAGYLMAEVLERQPPAVREHLLRTSILERVSGPLADFLTGSTGSERILLDLEEANAFVTSIDVGRTWFRYHHLFADFLRLELRRVDPGSVQALHRKAAGWHEEHGHPVEAIRHAQAAADWHYAARVLADCYVGLGLDGRMTTVRMLLSAFPKDVAAEDPELAVALAGSQMFDGPLEDTAAYIEFAERLAGRVEEERRWRFDVRVASTKLSLARRRGDLEATLAAMRSVEEVLASQSAQDVDRAVEHRATALMNLGIAELWALDVEAARETLLEALALARRIERPFLEVGCLAPLGIAEALAGKRVQDGVRLAERAIEIAEKNGWGNDPIIVPAVVIQAFELVWLGSFDLAERRLEAAEKLLPADGEPVIELVARFSLGLVRFGQGRLEEARDALAAAERVRSRLGRGFHTVDPRVPLIRIQVRLGLMEDAAAGLSGLGPEERDRGELRLAAATVHLRQGEPERALEVLPPVIDQSTEAVHPSTASMDALLLAAAAHDALGDIGAVEASIERALDIAESTGVVLPFAMAPVSSLLERHPRHKTAHATLLSDILDVVAGSGRQVGDAAPLREPLSEAELRVVRYLPSNLKAPEIAAELFVSPNTVRTHVRHIYSKLDAHSRREAVDRARELGLISPRSRLR